jgi:hypothetical protein
MIKSAIIFIRCLITFLAFTNAVASASQCNGTFNISTQVYINEYDPFSSTDINSTHPVSIQNTGDIACQYRILFVRTAVEASFEDKIDYKVVNASGADLFITAGTLTPSPPSLETSIIDALSLSTSNFFVSVMRGQLASPGTYEDTFDIVLKPLNDDIELDRRTLTLRLPVISVTSLNISGGGVHIKVDFGTLMSGQSRTVLLEAYSNENYGLQLMSQYGGELYLDQSATAQNWSIPYQLSVDGVTADISNSQILLDGAEASLGQRTHRLDFTIIDVSNKRAGIYKDVITAKIIPIF